MKFLCTIFTTLKCELFAILAVGLLAGPMVANAAPITSELDLTGTPILIDFSQFTCTSNCGETGPVQIGQLVGEDVTALVVPGVPHIWLYNDGWGLVGNGSWNSARNGFLGIFPGAGPVRIDFNSDDISGFGFFMNVCTSCGDPVTLSAFNSAGDLLELFNITTTANISTPNGVNDGAFRGIQLASSNISYIEIFGNTAVFDDLHFVRDDDRDGDGVLDNDDFCPDNTAIPEGVPTMGDLNPNHWALTDGDGIFDTVLKGKGKGPNRSYTIEDTAGCSCEQIIEIQGLGDGHSKYGCSISAMDDWIDFVNPM